MPELPEVEVVRRGIAGPLAGARIVGLKLGKPLRWPLGVAPEQLAGRSIQSVGRRGKYLLLQLDSGLLLLHLGMSGSLRLLQGAPPARGAHDHADLLTTAGLLRLHDPRRFGAVVWSPGLHEGAAARLLSSLGVEPLSDAFQSLSFHAALQGHRAAIKNVLLGGRVVVGVGNIYACEALFLAGIRPTVRACRLSRPRVARLHAAIRSVLQRAIDRGGSTLRNFSGVHGQAGQFQVETWVYGRQGKPCRRCGTAIRGMRQGQRSTFYCPQCQKF